MSVSSKKRKRHEAWEEAQEESLGGPFPWIAVDDQHGDVWLMWVYHVAPFEVRVEIQLRVVHGELNLMAWLYVDNERHQQIVCEAIDDEETRTRAEAQYGAMTRVRLMEAHKAAIVADEEAGLAQLEAAATAAGLYGKREPRRCVIPTWTTHDETGVANNSLGNN